MTVFRNEDRWDTSNVLFRDGRIVNYDKNNADPAMMHIDYGLLLMRREVLDTVPAAEKVDLADVLSDLVRRDAVAGFEVSERFYEIGSRHGLSETAEHIRTLRQTGEGK
jgi:NDP-sugar pyrophosphorylase family protein